MKAFLNSSVLDSMFIDTRSNMNSLLWIIAKQNNIYFSNFGIIFRQITKLC
jgi:hypothetical protein